mgnify:CR=1 FL=1
MIFLLREHSHSNDVATYYDNNKDYFYKVSHTEHGNYLINNEIKGFAFFNKLKLSEKMQTVNISCFWLNGCKVIRAIYF